MFTGEIISGSNYVRIGKVNTVYAFLDPIVEQMVSQNPNERMYPVDIIVKQLLVAQARERESETLKNILSATSKDEENKEYKEIPVPIITGSDFKNGNLYIFLGNLESYYCNIWFSILQQGNYDHISVMGYEPDKLSLHSVDTIVMKIPSVETRIIKDVAKYIKEWIVPATIMFNAWQRKRYNQMKREEEQTRQREIEKLRAEAQARDVLRSLGL
jgi:hypothetical protein